MEDYEKKYKEALEWAKQIKDGKIGVVIDDLIEKFPELKESEDGGIRKELIHFFKNHMDSVYEEISDNNAIIAWLEKQDEKFQYWNPSERQLEALDYAYNLCPDTERGNYYEGVLETLIDDLHKLSEKQGSISLTEDELEALRIAAYEPTKNWSEKLQSLYEKLARCEQGEQKPVISEYALREGIVHFGITQYQIDNWLKKYVYVEKQGKQKPANKVASKFKVWDWIVQEGVGIYKVVEVCKWYEVIGIDGNQYSISFIQENDYHLWSIKDAKDGDVLKEDSCTFIIERMKSNGTAIVHCCLFGDDDFDLGSNLSFDVDSTYPATKEQRDLLFSKMKESGYEWDDKKKELKKIEQNPAWNEKYIADVFEKVGLAKIVREQHNDNLTNALQDAMIELSKVIPQSIWSKEECVSVIERDGEKWVRVCALGEDFIIAAHDYRDGDKAKFTWEEACEIGTFTIRQAYIILALKDEINARLREIGGEPLDSYYWSSSEYDSSFACYVVFHSGFVLNYLKYNSYVARAVAAF